MKKPSISFVSLGCPKNVADLQVMLGLLNQAGFPVTNDSEEAELCLVNTCSFVEDARKESVATLVELAEAGKQLVISGCLAQHFKDELLKEIPEARAIIGTGDIHKVVDVVSEITSNPQVRLNSVSHIPNNYANEIVPRLNTESGAYAYLKIAEGCNHNCSFCIIPMLRGRFRSRSIESLVTEAQSLVDSGVKEIILVSQDSTYYGLDIYGKMALTKLLEQLHAIDGLEWIRIMYFYPSEITTALLTAINKLDKVVKYVDIPLQHSHPEILSLMARPKDPQKVIAQIRESIPNVKIRSTFIVGFPGETEEHFEHLHEFISREQFDRLGVFTYSQEMEVQSGSMQGQIPQKIKRARQKLLMQTQQTIAAKHNEQLVGSILPVLIESFDVANKTFTGRSQWDAPEVDNKVHVKDQSGDIVMEGDFVQVRIDSAGPYDLYGTAISS